MAHARFSIDKDIGLHNTALLEGALDSMPGIASVTLDKAQSSILVDYDSEKINQEAIRAKIEILGYPIERT